METGRNLAALIFCGYLLPFLHACCLGNYKCIGDENAAGFRVLSAGGNDMVFGPGVVYNMEINSQGFLAPAAGLTAPFCCGASPVRLNIITYPQRFFFFCLFTCTGFIM